MGARVYWTPDSQESAVEQIYTRNARGHTDIHRGYLNFGLWSPGIKSYVHAAENMVRTLAKIIDLKPGSKLLDVACGRGPQDLLLYREYGPMEIDAIDVTRVHVEAGRQAAEEIGCARNVRFKYGSATEMNFPEKSFTHALSIEGPVHFDTRERFVRHTYKLLKKGGRFALADYVMKRKPRTRLELKLLDATLALWKIPKVNAVTARDYEKMMKQAGFVDVNIREVGDLTIPGFYFEQRRLSFRFHKIRTQGILLGGVGFIADVAVYWAYKAGLIGYVLVDARKP